MATNEGARLAAALGPILLAVHHVGSTAIPGIMAKPIVDLLPVVTDLNALDAHQRKLVALGYAWWGEFGLPGRRYCTRDDAATGQRLTQLHCYVFGSAEINRHLAFRDYLRQQPDVARAYEREKLRCRELHPNDSHAYSDCKSQWIVAIEAEALQWRQSLGSRKHPTR
jgi:GrpB-like predicted nucleotidyltransferase (UPF0157 family)